MRQQSNNSVLPFFLGFISALTVAGIGWIASYSRGKATAADLGSGGYELTSNRINDKDGDDDEDFKMSMKLAHPHSSGGEPVPLTIPPSPRDGSDSQSDEIPSPQGRYEKHIDVAMADGLHDSLVRPCFKSLETAALVLRLARTQKDVRLQSKDMDDFFVLLEEIENSSLRKNGFDNTQVLVVEGLSGCGKSTLIESLKARGNQDLDMRVLKLPREVIDVADTFSDMPFAIAVAFEFVKLYVMAYIISKAGAKVVLVEKYYHDCFARSLLDHGLTIEDITSDPHATLFDWPFDLPRPTLVLYMTVSTDTRLRRRIQAGGSPERSTKRASVRDANLQTIHSLIKDSKVVAIDANGTSHDVASTAFEALDAYGLPLRSSASLSPPRVSLGVYGAMADVLPGSPM